MSSETTALVDPRTAGHRGDLACARQHEVSVAVATARAALPSWSRLTPKERAQRIESLARLVDDSKDAYITAEQAGTGKPEHEVTGEIEQVADLLRFYAWAARTELAPAAGGYVRGHESWVRWDPVGVVGAVVPWNYPLLMAAWRCAPALAAGNTVILKPAETTPDSVELLASQAALTLGAGVVQVLKGDRETGRLLVRSDVDMIAFTGSAAAGRQVAAEAGGKRISLELGGNSPVLVLPDAPPHTWEELARTATYNAGQSCAAPARVIVLEENYADVVEALGEAMAGRRAGAHFGPLNNADQTFRYDALVARSAAKTRVTGPVDVASGEVDGFWRPALLLADLPDDDPAVLEEMFGPVLTVQRAESIEHAIALANGVPQALAASVWTSDLTQGLQLAEQLNAGEVWLNCHLVQTAELPHGGRGASGHGTDLSTLALHEYQRPKTVTANLRAV